MTFGVDRDGAALHPGAAVDLLPELRGFAATLPPGAGHRLTGHAFIRAVAAGVPAAIAGKHLQAAARPVRAILFDKTPDTNWALGWHQDRTVAVSEPRAVAGFGPWSVKRGVTHVEPPFAVIAAMITLRLHIDAVHDDNAPLLIAPGSHRAGRVAEDRIAATVERCGIATCLADAGDIWAYATSILHASAAAAPHHRHRRVLQIDFASGPLPGGLTWLGV